MSFFQLNLGLYEAGPGVDNDSPRFIIAKYIPDVARMEPRNIGVILWTTHGIAARFIAENNDQTVDNKKIPKFVDTKENYVQWIKYWRQQLGQKEVAASATSSKISSANPEFLKAIANASVANYMLAMGGFVLDSLEQSDFVPVINQIFDRYIAEPSHDDFQHSNTHVHDVRRMCSNVFKQASITSDPNLKHRHTVTVVDKLLGKKRNIRFDYAYENGSLKRLYQRLPLTQNKGAIETDIYGCTWMFNAVLGQQSITKEDTGVFILPPEHSKIDKETQSLLQELSETTRVINLNDKQAVSEEVLQLKRLVSQPHS